MAKTTHSPDVRGSCINPKRSLYVPCKRDSLRIFLGSGTNSVPRGGHQCSPCNTTATQASWKGVCVANQSWGAIIPSIAAHFGSPMKFCEEPFISSPKRINHA